VRKIHLIPNETKDHLLTPHEIQLNKIRHNLFDSYTAFIDENGDDINLEEFYVHLRHVSLDVYSIAKGIAADLQKQEFEKELL
jgi:hypothetical protein